MRLAVPWTLLRRRRVVGAVLVVALGLVALAGAVALGPAAVRPHSTNQPRPDISPARPAIDRSVANAPMEERGQVVRVRALVQDLDGRPVDHAVVEVWADGRGCVDAPPSNEAFMRPDVIDG